MANAAQLPLMQDGCELIADYACEIGENPLWHSHQQRLYWTDIPQGRLFCFDPHSGQHSQIYEGRPVGGFTFQADGSLLLFRDRGSVVLWRDRLIQDIVPEIAAEIDSRFNDVIADPKGRVFCGTISPARRSGRLYCLNVDGSIATILDGIGCPNGMGFTLDKRGFYLTDSFAREIYLFDYDIDKGTLYNRRLFALIPESRGMPDGLTVDAEGCVWSAIWDGWSILRFLPSGDLAGELMLPARKVSSLTFGGFESRDIYITTAGGNAKEVNGQLAGALFRQRSRIQGVPEFASRVRVPAR